MYSMINQIGIKEKGVHIVCILYDVLQICPFTSQQYKVKKIFDFF